MVVIMPSFSQRHACEQQIVLTHIPGVIPRLSKLVSERVDRVGAMIHSDGGDEKPPNQQLPAAGAEIRPQG